MNKVLSFEIIYFRIKSISYYRNDKVFTYLNFYIKIGVIILITSRVRFAVRPRSTAECY